MKRSSFIEVPRNVISKLVEFFKTLESNDLDIDADNIESIKDFQNFLESGNEDAKLLVTWEKRINEKSNKTNTKLSDTEIVRKDSAKIKNNVKEIEEKIKNR